MDYEIKWGASYAPAPLHVMLDCERRTVSELLEEVEPDMPVAASKFTFDPGDMPKSEFWEFAKRIGRDVQIVHLTRDYRSVFLSIARGFVHSINPDRVKGLGKALRDGLAAADFMPAQDAGEYEISPEYCTIVLQRLFQNDRNVCDLQSLGFPYLQVEYRSIPRQLRNIAAFVGSVADTKALRYVLNNPAVNRLPPIREKKLVKNIEELEPIFKSFEKRRRRDIRASFVLT